MKPYNTLGERIKQARQKIGISQGELAKQLNCTQAALSQYERGAREPSLSDLVNIADRLNTTTDYLLGSTDVISNNVLVKDIGDYLGLNDESIECLHKMYLKRKIEEDEISREIKLYNGSVPGDENYTRTYKFIKKSNQQDLDDYKKTLNSFICSHSFSVLISNLMNNLFLERSVYDLLRIAGKKYNDIETCFEDENIVEQAYYFSENGEDNIKQYLLNLFEMQNSIMEFCQNFTKLEDVKKYEHSDSIYRRIVFSIYSTTRDISRREENTIGKMEDGLACIKETLGEHMERLLKDK